MKERYLKDLAKGNHGIDKKGARGKNGKRGDKSLAQKGQRNWGSP